MLHRRWTLFLHIHIFTYLHMGVHWCKRTIIHFSPISHTFNWRMVRRNVLILPQFREELAHQHRIDEVRLYLLRCLQTDKGFIGISVRSSITKWKCSNYVILFLHLIFAQKTNLKKNFQFIFILIVNMLYMLFMLFMLLNWNNHYIHRISFNKKLVFILIYATFFLSFYKTLKY